MNGEKYFNFKTAIEQHYIKADSAEPSEKDVLVEVYLKDELRTKPKMLCNTHFVLIIDISGSMDEVLESNKTKLQAVIEAAAQVISDLKQDDLISVVTFTNKEKVFCWGEGYNSKESLQEKISEIYNYPRGATNLAPALKAVKQNLEKTDKKPEKTATKLLILTDGEIHDLDTCEPIAKDFQDMGYDIDTLGIGADFVGEEMEVLTSGFMEKLENASQTKSVFEKSLRNLQNTVATKVKIELDPTEGVEVRGIAKISPDIKLIPLQLNSQKQHVIPFENVDRHRRYAAIVRLLINSAPAGEKAILTATLNFDVPKMKVYGETIERVVAVQFTNDTTKQDISPNSEVLHASTYYTVAIKAQEIQENSENSEVVMRNLKLIINKLKKIGDTDTMARWEAVRDDYITKGEFSLEEYNKIVVSKSKTSTNISSLPPPEISGDYDDEFNWE